MYKMCPLSILLASNCSSRLLWLVYLLTLSRSLSKVFIKLAPKPSKDLLPLHLLARIYTILLHIKEQLFCCELGSSSFLWSLFLVLKGVMNNPSLCISGLLRVLWTSIVFPLSCLLSRMKSIAVWVIPCMETIHFHCPPPNIFQF